MSDSKQIQGEFGLKRVLGLPSAVAIAVGQTVGAGVFVLTPIAIGIAGAGLPTAYLIAAAPVLCMLLILAHLAGAIPTVGGTYKYPSRLFSPLWAFIGIWGYAFGLLLGAFPLYAVSCVHYVNELLAPQGVHLNVEITAVSLLTFFYIVNIFGIEIAAAVQGAMVAILITALIVFASSGASHVNLANFQNPNAAGLGNLLLAGALLTFSQIGANALIELGGEIKKPGRTIPRAMLISLVIVALLYLVISMVAIGVRSPAEWNQYIDGAKAVGKEPTLIFAAEAFMAGFGLFFFVVGGALLAITTTLNSSYMWATKSVLVAASDGLIPQKMAAVNKRLGTPVFFLTVIWITSASAVMFDLPVEVFADFAAIGGLIIFIPVLISGYMLPKKMPLAYESSKFRLPKPIIAISVFVGVLLTLISMAFLVVDLKNRGALETLGLFGIWLVIGAVIFIIRKRKLPHSFKFSRKDLRREFLCEDLAHARLQALKVVDGQTTYQLNPEDLGGEHTDDETN